MRIFSLFLGSVFILLLSGCGGGSGEPSGVSGDLPPSRPASSVSGYAFDNTIKGGTVRVYDYSAGSKGNLLGTATTDDSGLYVIPVVSENKPVLIEVTGGLYIEESSGVEIRLDATKNHKLTSVGYYVSGGALSTNATFLTSLAHGLADYHIAQGMAVRDAVNAGNNAVSLWVGFDIHSAAPLDASNSKNASISLSDGLRYGFIAAAISEYTRQLHIDANRVVHSFWPSIAFVQIATDDIRADGLLDGVGAQGASLSFGGVALSKKVYQEIIATRMLQFVVSDNNRSSLVFDDVKAFALAMNGHDGELFGYQSGPDLTTAAPKFTNDLPLQDNVVKGQVDIQSVVTDLYQVSKVEFYVDGQLVATADDPSNPAFTLLNTNFSDGMHTITVVATNLFGNTATLSQDVRILRAGSVAGTAFDGLIIDGTVRVYDYSAGSKGDLLGTTITDLNGLYSLSIISEDTPVLVEVTGGFYREESSGEQIQLLTIKNHKLTAVKYYVSNTAIETSATYFTSVAHGLADYYVSQGMSVSNAVAEANSAMSAWAGFDIETVVPRDVADPVNASAIMDDGLKYGFVAAGISEYTRQLHVVAKEPIHKIWPSIDFIQLAADDIRADGLLDGIGDGGAGLSLGGVALSKAVYQDVIPTRILQFVLSDSNKTTLSFDTVKPFAFGLNAHAGDFFGNVAGSDLTTAAPTVVSFRPQGFATVEGTIDVFAEVSDLYKVVKIEYFISKAAPFETKMGADVLKFASLDTTPYGNGQRSIRAIATNILGNTVETGSVVTFANGILSLSLPVDVIYASGKSLSCSFTVGVNDGIGLGIASVYHGNTLLAVDIPGSRSFNIDMPITNSGSHCVGTVNISATDNVGNTVDGTYNIYAKYWSGGANWKYTCQAQVGRCNNF